MNNNEYIIEAEGLSFAYEDNDDRGDAHPALENINLQIKHGEYLSILGHNGSGKSTLAKIFNLILIPSNGKLLIDGKDVSRPDLSEDEIFDVRKKIGMVFQNPDNQLVATVVEEDIAFGPENLGLEREEIRRRVFDAVNLVGMQEYLHHAPHKLSGGQKQRVAIAGIIAMRPDCIIFDEATAMLDPIGRAEVMDIMEKLNREENITIINITHYMEEAARADRVAVIDDGHLVLDGSPKEVFSKVEYLHSIGLESPQCTELMHGLINDGFNVKKEVINVDECIDAICSYINDYRKK